MPPNSVTIEEEGAIIMPMLLVTDGKFQEEKILEIFQKAGDFPGCLASRRIQDNIADLQAQCAACRQGASQIQDLFQE
jgi:5-oxoprolinase (ATP-hydrolysing)